MLAPPGFNTAANRTAVDIVNHKLMATLSKRKMTLSH
jgi:hypothetical protein